MTTMKSKHLWEIFRSISDIPRCSKKETRIVEWLKAFAKTHQLECLTDKISNVIIRVPASKGYEHLPVLILQSHMDMVCEKSPQSNHNFDTDPIEWVTKQDWLYANDTTLGADNGIGMALSLAIISDKTVEHGALELLFTVNEEQGLEGAGNLDASLLKSRLMLNLDSEGEGIFTIGCAGGQQGLISLALTEHTNKIDTQQDISLKLTISGLSGGHSGVNITCQRANAIKLLADCLLNISSQTNLRLGNFSGGSATNAIPRDAFVEVVIKKSSEEVVRHEVNKCLTLYKKMYQSTDPNLHIQIDSMQNQPLNVYSSDSSLQAIRLINAFSHGVYRMLTSDQMTFAEPIAETSSNLAKIAVKDHQLFLHTSQRSSNKLMLNQQASQIKSLCDLAGANITFSEGYSAWQPNFKSQLLKKCVESYKEVTGQDAKVEVIHAGLECGVFEEKIQGLEAVSFGPTIHNPHSVTECVHIPSVERIWDFLKQLLKHI